MVVAQKLFYKVSNGMMFQVGRDVAYFDSPFCILVCHSWSTYRPDFLSQVARPLKMDLGKFVPELISLLPRYN